MGPNRFRHALRLAVLLLLPFHLACLVGYRDPGGGSGWRWGVPYGSYRESCRELRIEGNRLYGRCRDDDGNWVRTSLDLRRCDSDIRNVDGQLTCPDDLQYGLPRGSYERSCRDVRVERNVLRATCRTRDGRWRSTSLSLGTCDSTVSNDNGRLSCDD